MLSDGPIHARIYILQTYQSPILIVTGRDSLLFLPSGRNPCSWERQKVHIHAGAVSVDVSSSMCCASDFFSIPETWTSTPLVEELCMMVVHSMSRATQELGLDMSYLKSSSILHVGEMRGGAGHSSN